MQNIQNVGEKNNNKSAEIPSQKYQAFINTVAVNLFLDQQPSHQIALLILHIYV